MMIPVILSGGSGTRLWPVSTTERPKQFHALVGETSMFRETMDRVADRTRFAAPIIVCGPSHVDYIAADLSGTERADVRIIIEPAARNTAPAIALAALVSGPQSIMLVMPADHAMTAPPRFLTAIEAALPAVRDGALATFGIDPSHPETGYGYIAAGRTLDGYPGIHAVHRFVEKPNRDAAEAMLRQGGHYWNAGIFLMRADRYLAELARQQPAIHDACTAAMNKATTTGDRIYPDAASVLSSPSNSIDYAVMEGAERIVVAPVDPGWSDVGGWAALYELGDKDDGGNVHIGDVLSIDGLRNYIRATPGKRVSIVGMSDLVVVVEGDDIMILPLDRAQEVRALAQARSRTADK